jgi:nitrate reductase gamma subunit
MGIWHSVFGVIGLIVLITVGVSGFGWYAVFAVVIPYAAILFFICGFIYRIVRWASAPVPFSIPTVSGQQKSLSWIKASNIDSPHTTAGVIGRLALEILLFRSLLKNEKVELQEPQKLFFRASMLLWLGAMAFHWSLLVIVLRHFRFFLEPVPSAIVTLQRIDSILQGLLPILYITDILIVLALAYLFVRRVIYPQIRYISLASDYFVLLVIAGISVSGILMRLIYKVDSSGEVMGDVDAQFQPTFPMSISYFTSTLSFEPL